MFAIMTPSNELFSMTALRYFISDSPPDLLRRPRRWISRNLNIPSAASPFLSAIPVADREYWYQPQPLLRWQFKSL